MKKKTFLIIVSIIELLSLIIFFVTLYHSLSSTVKVAISVFFNNNVTLSNSERLILKINNIVSYIFLIALIIRFIFVNKKMKILLASNIFILICGFYLAFIDNGFIKITGLILLIASIIIYLYSYKIDLKDDTLLKDTFKKAAK